MCADIFTKAFTDIRQWGGVCALINTIAPDSLPDLVRSEIQQSAPSGGDSTLSDGSSESNCAPALRKSNTNNVVASGASAARHDIVVANSRNVSLVVHDMLERGPHGDYRIGAVCRDEHVCITLDSELPDVNDIILQINACFARLSSLNHSEDGLRSPSCEWHSVTVYQHDGAGQTKKIHSGSCSEQIVGIMALGCECELRDANGVDFFTNGRAVRPDEDGFGFTVFGRGVACVSEIESKTTVLVFRRIHGRELPPLVQTSLDLLGFYLGPWENECGQGPYPKIAVRPLEGGDGAPTTVVRALRSYGIPGAAPAMMTGSLGAAQKEGLSSAGEGSIQLQCVPGSQVSANRTLIECCCGGDSLLGMRTESSRGCKVNRITEKVDMTKPEVVRGCDLLLRDGTCALWFSCPCTGGSAWQRYNATRSPKTAELINGHSKKFRKLWKAFVKLASIARSRGVRVFIEWPRGCAHWKDSRVSRFLVKHGFRYADFDGCMYGLVAESGPNMGEPINKPWRVACVNSSLPDVLNRKCSHEHKHAPCAGSLTKGTEGYTDEIVSVVHESFTKDVLATGENSESNRCYV